MALVKESTASLNQELEHVPAGCRQIVLLRFEYVYGLRAVFFFTKLYTLPDQVDWVMQYSDSLRNT